MIYQLVFLSLVQAVLIALLILPLSSASSKCASYDSQSNTINLVCDTNLSGIDSDIGNKNVLREESEGVWILNAIIDVSSTAKLIIDSGDTRWLKITNSENGPNFIIISGNAIFDGIKITSWNLTDNDIIKQNNDGSIPRSYIRIEKESGVVDILDSEIAFLGYKSTHGRTQGLSYYGGDGSMLSNNIFHDMWYAFYSSSIGFVTISDNHYYNNSRYAIDPHSGSHDFRITNNIIYNSGTGAICSHDCYKILFEGNKIHGGKNGVMFSRNTSDSVAKNNHIYGANTGIVVTESDNNEIYNNTIEESNTGIKVHNNSSKNYIHDNTVNNGNRGIYLVDVNSMGNLFENNNLSGMTYAVRVSTSNANNNSFVNNNPDIITDYEYYVSHDGTLNINSQTFTNDRIRGGSGNNTVDIFSSGEITVDNQPIDTDSSGYYTMLSKETINIDSIG